MPTGEEIYSSKFILLDSVDEKLREDLHEHLYKTTWNLGEAFFYYELLKMLNKKNKDNDVAGASYVMAFICFCTFIRKIVDRASECNLRRLISYTYDKSERKQKIKLLDKIYGRYRPLIDNIIAHQGKGKIVGTEHTFPDENIVLQDLEELCIILDEIAKKICQQWLRPQRNHHALIDKFDGTLT